MLVWSREAMKEIVLAVLTSEHGPKDLDSV